MIKRSVWLRGAPFLLLFPGYFAYHWLALEGLLPLLLGGYVNEVSAFVLLGVALAAGTYALSGRRVAAGSVSAVDVVFLGFMAYFAAVVLIQAGIGNAPGTVRNHVASWVQLLATFLAFRLYPYGHTSVQGLILFAWVGATLAVLGAAQSDALGLLLQSSDDSRNATYQGLARAYLLTAMLVLGALRGVPLRLIVYATSAFSMFLIGARSEIAALLVFAVVFEVASARRPVAAGTAVAAAGAAVLSALWLGAEWLDQAFPDNRFLFLLLQGREDGSVVERSEQMDLAWAALSARPVWGDYGHYEAVGGAGFYAHNVVSVWVDLGVPGLVMLALLFGLATLALLPPLSAGVPRRAAAEGPSLAFCYGVLVQVVVLLALAKVFTDISLATFAGVVSAHLAHRRHPRSPAPLRPTSSI